MGLHQNYAATSMQIAFDKWKSMYCSVATITIARNPFPRDGARIGASLSCRHWNFIVLIKETKNVLLFTLPSCNWLIHAMLLWKKLHIILGRQQILVNILRTDIPGKRKNRSGGYTRRQLKIENKGKKRRKKKEKGKKFSEKNTCIKRVYNTSVACVVFL